MKPAPHPTFSGTLRGDGKVEIQELQEYMS